MAVVHHTTLEPGKLELLTAWVPTREWFTGTTPHLHKAGGFRLDDPDGEVGIEHMLVADTADSWRPVYHVPMTYRGAPLPGAEEALIGTSEHGVLGTRWIYDAAHDPVALAQMAALLAGRAVAQDQNRSDTPARTVEVSVADSETSKAVRVNRIPSPAAVLAPGWVRVSWTDPEGVAAAGVVLEVAVH
ncbi:1,4-alpha-glucan branching protein [Nocardia nova]|uniref:1,4-alpha-glucan branching protein n=1 Tax=Nocardia nova TaxID=37330 RepID=A0A2S6AUD3_9NOCA|nr:1,4-alpha-glucan branching protein [Nocardia nova]PPJ30824.1 1,4-alpha-glucan branching protein [Nocardia nova]PPJ38820.1 1,4-alpha-glucan branching protein [Nocardia nova]